MKSDTMAYASWDISSLDDIFMVLVAESIIDIYSNEIRPLKKYRSSTFRSFYHRVSSYINTGHDDRMANYFVASVCGRMRSVWGYPEDYTLSILYILFNDSEFIGIYYDGAG